MKTALPIVAAMALVLATGLLHGWWTERWQRSPDVQDAVARLQDPARLPCDVGDWKCDDTPVDQAALAQAGAESYWIRKYTNSRTKQVALVILLCGRSGRMSVHRPEYCYRGAGYEMVGSAVRTPVKVAADEPPVEFWTGLFRKEEPTQTRTLRIYWTWFSGDSWQSPPGDPRLAFARHPALYKLYVVHDVEERSAPPEKDSYLDLIRRLLPPLTRALTPEPPQS